MIGKSIATVFVVLGITALAQAQQARCPVDISLADGKTVATGPEDLGGLTSKPLAELKAKLDKERGRGFVTFWLMTVKEGSEVAGKYEIKEKDLPCRLTVYQISKEAGKPRMLRIVATGFHDKTGAAEFRATMPKIEENVFIITAEKVKSADELNSHLKYMNSQNNSVTLKGYSTNWKLTALKLQMAGKDVEQKDDIFTKEADWLVNQLINPLWVVSVRVETK